MSEAACFEPIGHVRSPFVERVQAPRQARLASGVAARVELCPGRHFEDALSDLEQWEYLWLITWLSHNTRWRPKVRPPRSDVKRGVFATRAPHRPNPIGLSAVRLVSVEGLSLHIAEVDLLDGTPVLDIKPYVAWADAIPEARGGWLDQAREQSVRPDDPGPAFAVDYSEQAESQLAYLEQVHGIALRDRIETVLSTGPRPHAYRRIRALGSGRYQLAIKDWRAVFGVSGCEVSVEHIESGYRRGRSRRPAPDAHRDFAERFGDSIS